MSEPHYDVVRAYEAEKLGLMSGHGWINDPKRLVFTLSRYKFVAKMLEGRKIVLEVGCGDAFGTRIVQQTVGHVTAIDFDPVFVADARRRAHPSWPFGCLEHDMAREKLQPPKRYDAAFALDVLEHIPRELENNFLDHIVWSLADHGVAIFGMPSLESQRIASSLSVAGHVNCKSGPDLYATLSRHFHAVFPFAMNDEVVHTGHSEMAHYLLAVCADPRALRVVDDSALRSSP